MSPTTKRFAIFCVLCWLISGIAGACMAIECQHDVPTELDCLYGWLVAMLFVLMVGLPSDNQSNKH